jgi:mannose-6-phosphate isomerase
MATSDNVLRAGLTPKTRDVDNLLSSLTYHASAPSAHIVAPAPFSRGSECTKLYNPPIPEFAVLLTHVSEGGKETHDSLEGPSLLIVTKGKGQATWPDSDPLAVKEGSVVFVGANTKVTFEASEDMTLFRAFVEV